MKLLECVLDSFIQEMLDIDAMQIGFVPGRGTTDAIFIIRHLQEKYIAASKPLYFAFVGLEKAFDRVPRKVLWWALRSLGVGCTCHPGHVYGCQKPCPCQRSVQQGFLGLKLVCIRDLFLAPWFFILVLEALSRQFHTGVPWELLYADNLAVMADSLEE